MKSLQISDEQIGEAFKNRIQSAVERIMEQLLTIGYTVEELEYAQEFIEWWVINDADDALSLYFDSTFINDTASNPNFTKQINKAIEPVKHIEDEE